MQVEISSSGDGAGLDKLFFWLRRSRELTQVATVTTTSSGQAGQMAAVDVINVVLTHVTALANLALAYAAWRESQVTAPPVTFTRDKISITVHDASPETVRRICEALAPGGENGNGA